MFSKRKSILQNCATDQHVYHKERLSLNKRETCTLPQCGVNDTQTCVIHCFNLFSKDGDHNYVGVGIKRV